MAKYLLKPQVASINFSHPMTRQLVFCMPFFEGGGTPKDLSINNITATPTNGPTWQTGAIGKEMKFVAGSDQYINLGNPVALQITNSISIACGYSVNSFPAAGADYQLVTKDKDTGGRAYTMDMNNEGAANGGTRFYINGGAGNDLVVAGGQPVIGEVMHAVGTFNVVNKNIRIFTQGGTPSPISGIAANNKTSTTATIPSATANVLIGRREYTGFTEPLNGTIKYVYIWNRALSPKEVSDLFINPWCFLKRASKGI